MSAEQVQDLLDEAAELAIVSGDLTIDEAIVKFEQQTQRLERARDTRGEEV
jgi:hypothetical protein